MSRYYVIEQDINTAMATVRDMDADAFTLKGFTYSGRGTIIIVFEEAKRAAEIPLTTEPPTPGWEGP